MSYDARSGRTVRRWSESSANSAPGGAEIEHQDRPEMDIVLVGSDSLDTIRTTHSTYFTGAASKVLELLRDTSEVTVRAV